MLRWYQKMRINKNVICAFTAIGLLVQPSLLANADELNQESTDWTTEIAAVPNFEPKLLKSIIPNTSKAQEQAELNATSGSEKLQAEEPETLEHGVTISSASEGSETALAEGENTESGPFKSPLISSGDGLLAERIGFDESPSSSFNQIDLLSKQVILKDPLSRRIHQNWQVETLASICLFACGQYFD